MNRPAIHSLLPSLVLLLAACGLSDPEGPRWLRIAGTVVDTAGFPIAGAQVGLHYPSVGCGHGYTEQYSGSSIVATDAAGHYAQEYGHPCQADFYEQPDRNCGSIYLWASATGYDTVFSATRIRCVPLQVVDFALAPAP